MASLVLPQCFEAGARFRHRLLGRGTDEELAVHRALERRKLLGGVFVLGGLALLLAGVGVL